MHEFVVVQYAAPSVVAPEELNPARAIVGGSDQSGQYCLTFIFVNQAGLVSPGAVNIASMLKSMQPTKSSSGLRVVVHGAPPFTSPVRRSDFFGTSLAPA